MKAAQYDAWYDSPRGRWIGESEFQLARKQLAPHAGASILDVGCGTGWFTRRFASTGGTMTGLDLNRDSLVYARGHSGNECAWVQGDAHHLPFPDKSFDYVLSIAALCFTHDERIPLAEMIRVTRGRFVAGWLNRSSLLYSSKVGRGDYRGVHWHTATEVRALFEGLAVEHLSIHSAVFLPDGGHVARFLEKLIPNCLNFGALLISSGDVVS